MPKRELWARETLFQAENIYENEGDTLTKQTFFRNRTVPKKTTAGHFHNY